MWCVMVREYLEKLRKKYSEERKKLLEEKTLLNNRLKENTKLIQLLEETNDPNYESFTPRDVNSHNRERICELQTEQKTVTEQLDDLETALYEVECDLDELDSMMKVIKEKEKSVTESDINKLALLEVQEKERQRIARDLHDSTVQNLTSLLHKSELCARLIELDPIRCKLELSSLNKTLRDVIDDTRNLIFNLRPMSFDDIGFDVTVEHYLDKLMHHSNVRFTYKTEGEPYKLAGVISITILRIIQEACSNSVKHANASNVNITLTYYKDHLLLTITDDGQGFDLSTVPEQTRNDYSGFGLSMMKERVYLLSGTFDIQSETGKGCIILINIPIKEDS